MGDQLAPHSSGYLLCICTRLASSWALGVGRCKHGRCFSERNEEQRSGEGDPVRGWWPGRRGRTTGWCGGLSWLYPCPQPHRPVPCPPQYWQAPGELCHQWTKAARSRPPAHLPVYTTAPQILLVPLRGTLLWQPSSDPSRALLRLPLREITHRDSHLCDPTASSPLGPRPTVCPGPYLRASGVPAPAPPTPRGSPTLLCRPAASLGPSPLSSHSGTALVI